MTSRVQKGGPIFRPVAKSRGPRQASVVSESPAIPSLAVGPSRSVATLPPPATPSALITSSGTSTLKPTPLNQPSSEPPNAPTPIQAPQPPSIISSRTGTPINTPQPRPPVLASHTNVIPTLGSPITIAPGNTSRAPAKPIPIPNPSSQLDNSHRHEAVPIPTPTPRPASSNYPPQIAEASQVHIHTPTNTLASSSVTVGMSSEQATMVSHTMTPAPTNGTEPSSSVQTPAPKPTKKRKRTPRSTPATATDEDPQDENEPSSGSGKRKRRASSTPRSRRSRGSSLPPFDPNADPGEDLDPTAVTMASLCEDTGQGRVSSKAVEILTNHVAWKAANRIKRARMKALMEAKKYGREEEFERDSARESGSSSQSPDKGNSSPAVPGSADRSPANDASGIAEGSNRNSPAANATGNAESGGFDYTQDLETNRFNVQVRIGPNGETIIDESTLEVDRTEPEDTTNYTHVVESDQTKFVNSGTYSKRYRGSRWSAEETEMFYHALSQYGENYELIAYVLPGRDRKSCKNKFKAEDKKNPARINYCLRNSTPVDMETLSKMTGKDFSGPVPEIRARPVPQLVPTEGATSGSGDKDVRDTSPPAESSSRKKNRAVKKALQDDDGVLVVGDADHFDPAFE